MNTLMGVKGRDFVLLGGDSAFFRSVVIMDRVSTMASLLALSEADMRRKCSPSHERRVVC